MAQATTSATQARLRFLNEAADVLIASSPATSALLGVQHDCLERNSGRPRHARDKTNCNACGAVLIPSWSCKRTKDLPKDGLTTRSRKSNAAALSRSHAPTFKCFTCGSRSCSTATRTSTSQCPPTDKTSREKTGLTQDAPAIGKTSLTTVATPSPNGTEKLATSTDPARKRTRARKTGGLQALLLKSKVAPPASGLDLMDFLKGT